MHGGLELPEVPTAADTREYADSRIDSRPCWAGYVKDS
jgi:hypothetical protein